MSIAKLTFRKLKADIKFDSISYKVKRPKQSDESATTGASKHKYILTNVAGHFKHGQLHAIMGSSGCGKSSLLNVLAGFNGFASGTIALNNFETTCDCWAGLISPVRSYILQDDLVIPQLTVREQLHYAVELKVPGAADERRRKEIIDILLRKTGLKECSERSLGKISGGQRKRVSVASELVNYPPVIFLDEPTTGLDSTSCYRLVELLKSVAKNGCNVIATIHQPNSRVFHIFDTLTVLHEGGVVAYRGPAMALAGAMSRINHIIVPVLANPADVLFQADNIKKMAEADPRIRQREIRRSVTSAIVRKQGSNYSGRSQRGHAAGRSNEYDLIIEPREMGQLCESVLPNGFHRFQTFFRRTLLQSRRDMVFFLGRLCGMFAGALAFSLVFQKIGGDAQQLRVMGNLAFLFFLTLFCTMATSVVAIMTSHDYLQVFLREHINSWYALPTFFVSRGIIDNVTAIVVQFPFIVGMWFVTDQQQDFSPAVFLAMILFCGHSIVTHYVSLTVAMFTEKATLPQLPYALVMVQVLFTGYFIRLVDLPGWAEWLQYVAYGSFTYAGLLKLAYSTEFTNKTVHIPCSGAPQLCMVKTGDDVLAFWRVEMAYSVWHSVYILAGYSVFFCVLCGMLLGVYIRKQRRIIARL